MSWYSGGLWGVAELAVLMALGIPLAAVVGVILVAIIKVLKGGSSRRESDQQAEETRLIQELHDGLERMEERVEALETLLLDRDDRGHQPGTKRGRT